MRATTKDAMTFEDFCEEQRIRVQDRLFMVQISKELPGVHAIDVEYRQFSRNDFFTRKQVVTELTQERRGRV
jgi:hypothetical protein